MKKLNLYQTTAIDKLIYAEENTSVTIESPALAFAIDFSLTRPLVIDAGMAAIDVRKLMKKNNVRMQFVVNDNNDFIGIVTTDDLIDGNLIKVVSEGFKREDIPVKMFMTERQHLKALDYKEISRCTIADVIAIMKESGQQHYLIVDLSTHTIRGVISASEISRRLDISLDIQQKSDFYRAFATAV